MISQLSPGNIRAALIYLFIGLASFMSYLTVADDNFAFIIFGGFLVLILAATLFKRPSLSLLMILVYIWLISGRADPQDLFSAYPIVRWGTYLFIPAIALITLVRVYQGGGYWYRSPIDFFLIALVAVMTVSAIINDTGMSAILYSIGVYLRYPLFFILMINLAFKEKIFSTALKFFLLISVLLILEAYFNYFVFGRSKDTTFFTVGVTFGSLTAGIFFIYSLCFVIAHALNTRFHWYHGVLICLAFGAAWIALIRSVYVIVPILSVILWGIRFHLVKPRLLLIMAFILLGMMIASFFLPWDKIVAQLPFLSTVNPSYRLSAVRDVMSLLKNFNLELFGFGPRSFSPGGIGQMGQVYALFIEEKGEYFTRVVSVSQFVNVFAELGYVGFALYWLMLLRMLMMNIQFHFSLKTANSLQFDRKPWLITSLAYVGIWFHYSLFGLVYFDIWRIDVSSLIFWTISAAIFLKMRQIRNGVLIPRFS